VSIAASTGAGPTPSRRARAAMTVDAAFRGALLAAIVATVAWLLVSAIAATAFVFLVIATLAAAAWAVLRERLNSTVWVALGAAWAVVLIERWTVQEHGGLWVAAAAYLGLVVGARRAGIRRRWLPLLAYPALSVAIVILAGEDLLDPWGTSWLWVAAILGPPLGARTLLRPAQPKAP
jgi:hypothetical protein